MSPSAALGGIVLSFHWVAVNDNILLSWCSDITLLVVSSQSSSGSKFTNCWMNTCISVGALPVHGSSNWIMILQYDDYRPHVQDIWKHKNPFVRSFRHSGLDIQKWFDHFKSQAGVHTFLHLLVHWRNNYVKWLNIGFLKSLIICLCV